MSIALGRLLMYHKCPKFLGHVTQCLRPLAIRHGRVAVVAESLLPIQRNAFLPSRVEMDMPERDHGG
jgi:hypothetical protein